MWADEFSLRGHSQLFKWCRKNNICLVQQWNMLAWSSPLLHNRVWLNNWAKLAKWKHNQDINSGNVIDIQQVLVLKITKKEISAPLIKQAANHMNDIPANRWLIMLNQNWLSSFPRWQKINKKLIYCHSPKSLQKFSKNMTQIPLQYWCQSHKFK